MSIEDFKIIAEITPMFKKFPFAFIGIVAIFIASRIILEYVVSLIKNYERSYDEDYYNEQNY